MRDASTPKLDLAVKKIHVDSFEVLFSKFFLLTWRFHWIIGLDVF